MQIKIDSPEEKELIKNLEARTDAEAGRMERFLKMPDLSRTPGSPIHELAQRIVTLPDFKDFDIIETPEIVQADISFDLFDFPPDHPARSKSDTYYADEKNILRTHTTVMWYYYLMREEINSSFPNIGNELGGRDHTTAMHAYNKISQEIEVNEKMRRDLELIKQRLYAV